MGFEWYVMRSKPNQERVVLEQLQNQPVDTFLPFVKVNPVNPRSRKERPYFPGYLFVYGDLDEIGATTLNHIYGSHGLVRFEGEPAIVPEALIVELVERVDAINAAGGLDTDGLQSGDTVKIVSGPFAGYEAIFDMKLPGKDRVQVLLAFLSQYPQKLKLHSADIEKRS
jgi:transcriptional antiterminator RfaH